MIGSGPAGQKAAIAAAKARKHVAVIDRTTMIGGVSVHTGTIPNAPRRAPDSVEARGRLNSELTPHRARHGVKNNLG